MPADVVIVGAGSAGCVLASRLSEDGERDVVLLESGSDYPIGLFTDGADLPRMLDAVRTARRLAAADPLRSSWGPG